MEVLNLEMVSINNENRALARRCEYLEKLVEDTRAMAREDNISF
jgi:hypothetical protein